MTAIMETCSILVIKDEVSKVRGLYGVFFENFDAGGGVNIYGRSFPREVQPKVP